MKKKHIIIISIFLAVIIIVFLLIRSTKNNSPKNFFLNTTPLIENSKVLTTPKDNLPTFKGEGIPPQTNYKKVAEQITTEVSQIEKSKIIDLLPIRIENFQTNTPITTTINVFTLESDPPHSIRIEIYGPNFNNISKDSTDAIAFKNSFLEIKKTFDQKKMKLNNLQIIYGNRQYIQDTATFWVKEFNLLN